MNSYQNIKSSSNDFQTEAPYCCFDGIQQTDYQYACNSKTCTPFTGKELDSETGYSYFGARYYDAELSGLFFSVDPMADKYPNVSSYNYCMWNPIKLLDPDGRDSIYFNLNMKEIKRVKCEDIIIMLSLTKGVDTDKSLDVRNIDLDRMDRLYSFSDRTNKEVLFYVKLDGEFSENIVGDNQSVTFSASSYLYDVHTHCLNILDENNNPVDYGKIYPSLDKDMAKPKGQCLFGFILAYKEREGTTSGKSIGNGGPYNPQSVSLDRYISMYDNNGMFEHIRYDTFKKVIRAE